MTDHQRNLTRGAERLAASTAPTSALVLESLLILADECAQDWHDPQQRAILMKSIRPNIIEGNALSPIYEDAAVAGFAAMIAFFDQHYADQAAEPEPMPQRPTLRVVK